MPAVTAYAVGSLKSTHVKVVLMLAGLDCSSNVPAEPPLTAYSAAMAFPGVAPLMYAMMSVIEPEVVHVKYETDCALGSFWSK